MNSVDRLPKMAIFASVELELVWTGWAWKADVASAELRLDVNFVETSVPFSDHLGQEHEEIICRRDRRIMGE